MYAALHVLMICCFIERLLSKMKPRLRTIPENSFSVLLRVIVCGSCQYDQSFHLPSLFYMSGCWKSAEPCQYCTLMFRVWSLLVPHCCFMTRFFFPLYWWKRISFYSFFWYQFTFENDACHTWICCNFRCNTELCICVCVCILNSNVAFRVTEERPFTVNMLVTWNMMPQCEMHEILFVVYLKTAIDDFFPWMFYYRDNIICLDVYVVLQVCMYDGISQ